MKIVDYVDDRGYNRRALLRDNDSELNVNKGIPQDVPDLDKLNWDDIKRDLHNELFNLGLFTFKDLQVSEIPNVLQAAILSALKSRLVSLFREEL